MSQKHTKVAGFTLAEMLITLAVLAITASLGIPAMGTFLEKNRVRGAAEILVSEIQFARTEAVKRNQPLSITFSEDTGSGGSSLWCFGLDENPGCDCTLTNPDDANACALTTAGTNVLKTVSSDSYPNITLSQTFTGNSATVSPVRGTVSPGNLTVESHHGMELAIQVTVLGRVHTCSDDVLGYDGC